MKLSKILGLAWISSTLSLAGCSSQQLAEQVSTLSNKLNESATESQINPEDKDNPPVFEENSSSNSFEDKEEVSADVDEITGASTSTPQGSLTWSGTASILHYNSTRTGFGLNLDVANIHPSNVAAGPQSVFFQWQVDMTRGPRLEIKPSNDTVVTLRI